MRIVFMGTPEFAVPSLRLLAAQHEVSLVVTRPDAVRGRGKKLLPSPVKEAALELGIEVAEASRVTPDLLERLRAARPDIIVVAAYGCLLPDTVLSLAPLGCVNVHASLLPRWRGAAPIQRAVLAGDERIGVSIMRLVQKMDAGAYCAQASVSAGEKGAEELLAELAELGAACLLEALGPIEAGTAVWTEQDESLVTFAPKVEKSEMRLSPADDAEINARRVRAQTDAAPARALVAGKGVRVLQARVATGAHALDAGAVRVKRGTVLLGCADAALELLRVKPDGKREMEAAAWAQGLRGDGLVWEA